MNIFSINWELLAYSPPGWGRMLLIGLFNTMQVAIGGYCLGLVIGLFGALGKLYGSPIIRDLVSVYTTIIRGVPELVLILMLYYVGTALLNDFMAMLNMSSVDVSGLVAGIVVIALVQGGYSTEVIRAAILAVNKGQLEAGRALGMSPLLILRRITIPAMIPFSLPGLANLWLITTKDTALLAVVGFMELTLVARQAAGTTKAYVLFFLAAGSIYLAITLISTCFIRLLERRYSRGQERT